MTKDLTDFWRQFQSGVDIAVASSVADKLLGVRDGFLRYFADGLGKTVPVSVKARPQDEGSTALPMTDAEILQLAHGRAIAEQAQLGGSFDFYVGSEAGLLSFEAAGQRRHFVRCWTVVLGLGDQAWGSSGSLQLPELLIHGLGPDDFPCVVPGTRRSGGMVSSLTGGLENRRSTTELSTLSALATLMWGLGEGLPRQMRERQGQKKLFR